MDAGLPVQPWPFLNIGQRVVVEAGPLTGAEGIVVEMKKEYGLVVSITMLQRAVAVEVDRDWIRAIGPRVAKARF